MTYSFMSIPLGLMFAFTAGLFALFSPCGFPMLPGYISYYLGAKVPVGRALTSGVSCLVGLLSVFSVVGLMVSTLSSIIASYLPFFELVAGMLTILIGLGMIVEVRFPQLSLPLRAPRRRGFLGVFLYGILYGLATLGCSAPIFFAVLLYALTLGGSVYGIVVFIVYAAGMGLPLLIITLLVARAKSFILKRVRRATSLLHKLGGIVIISVGVYLMYYYFATVYLT